MLSKSSRDALTQVKKIRDIDGNSVQLGTPDSELISVRSLPMIACEINAAEFRKRITGTHRQPEGKHIRIYTLEEVKILSQAESEQNSQIDTASVVIPIPSVITIPSKVTDVFKQSIQGRYVCADEICQTPVKAVAEKVKGILFDFEPTVEQLPITMRKHLYHESVNVIQFDQYYAVRWVTDAACYQGLKHHKNCSCKQQVNKTKISSIKSDFRVYEFFPKRTEAEEGSFNLWGYLFEQGRVEITPKDLSDIVVDCLT